MNPNPNEISRVNSNFSDILSKFNWLIFLFLLFLAGILPILYLQQSFLLNLSTFFLNQILPFIFWVLFFVLAIFVAIRTKVRSFVSIFFGFLSIAAISLYFLATSIMGFFVNRNDYLGKCENNSVYKIGQFHLGDSSEHGLSIAKSQIFGLAKVPIYGILENNYDYKTSKLADKAWRIFKEPQSDAKVNLYFEKRPLEKVILNNNLSNCPDLVEQIEQKYQIILNPKTLNKIKSEFTYKIEDQSVIPKYIEYNEFIKPQKQLF